MSSNVRPVEYFLEVTGISLLGLDFPACICGLGGTN